MEPLALLTTCALLFPGSNGFTAKLQPPWVPGGGGVGGKRMGQRGEQPTEINSASDPLDDNEDGVPPSEDPIDSSASSSPSGGTGNSDPFPNSRSTNEAARVFFEDSPVVAPGAIAMKINGDKTRLQPKMTSPNARAASQSNNQNSKNAPPTVKSCLKPLLKMTRPSNVPGVILFHILGVHLALKSGNVAPLTSAAVASPSYKSVFLSTLLRPSMMVVLLTLLLTSATSMVVNDYYDARSGVDAAKARSSAARKRLLGEMADVKSSAELSAKPLATGEVPMRVAKRFLSYLYATLMISVAFVPGSSARLSVALGAMLTFWYTQHLKPRIWLKNVTCAALIALSPLTSGSAALHLTNPLNGSIVRAMTSLGRLILVLFSGFMGREILMDVLDCESDRAAGVRTVPVRHGRRYATRTALGFTASMSALAVIAPAVQLWNALGGLEGPLSIAKAWATPALRRSLLAVSASGWMVWRVARVVSTEGNDLDLIERAVEEGKMSVLLLLASFV